MKLNGWQRLWIVLTVLWMLPNVFVVYGGWPTVASISKADVYMKLKNDDGNRLADYYDVLAAQFGGTKSEDPRADALRHDKAFLAASTKEQKAYLVATDPDFAKLSTVHQNAYLGSVIGTTGPVVDVEGHTITFVMDIPETDMNRTASAYDAILRGILRQKRAALIGTSVALWIVPALAVYALGLALVWVRQGFRTVK